MSYGVSSKSNLEKKYWDWDIRLCSIEGQHHWGWVTHICVSKLTTIGSNNGLLPGWHQATVWTNVEILLIQTLGTNFCEILSEIHTFSFKKMHLNCRWRLTAILSWPQCVKLDSFHQVSLLCYMWQIMMYEPRHRFWQPLNTLRPRQKHFANDIFKCTFFNENVWISLKISQKFDPKFPVNNISSLVQIMAWRRPGDKPLSEPMMVSLQMHICVTRPQWVFKQHNSFTYYINESVMRYRSNISVIIVHQLLLVASYLLLWEVPLDFLEMFYLSISEV